MNKLIILSFTLWSLAGHAIASPEVIPEVSSVPKKIGLKKTTSTAEVTHITRDDIKNSPVTDFSELLMQQQSIVRLTNNAGDNSQTALSIRGFGDNASANSLILIDGFPLTNPSLLAPNFNSLALSDIERIDILQGSEGVLWGDQAVGGVVNIVTRHPEKFFTDANVALGSYAKNFYGVTVGDKSSQGIYGKAFGFTNTTHNYRAHDAQSNQSAAMQIGYDYARGTISLNVQGYKDTFYLPGGLTEEQYDSDPRQATNFTGVTHFRTADYQLLNKHELSANWLLETRLYHHETTGDGFVYSKFNRLDQLDSIAPRLTGFFHNNKITMGYLGQVTQFDFENTKNQSHVNTAQNNLFYEVVSPLTQQIDLTLGARGAWQNNDIDSNPSAHSVDRVLVTEQGISYKLTDAWRLFLRRDGNFSFPKANEEAWIPAGADSLDVQTGVSYETGVEYLSARHRTQLNVYQLTLHNEIAFDPAQTPELPFGSYTNFDKTKRSGVTWAEHYMLMPAVSLDGQLNVVNARFASGSEQGHFIPAVPAVNGNIGVNYEFVPGWHAIYRALYTGSRYASEDIENVGEKQPGYWLHDMAVQYVQKSYSVNCEVTNLFNQKYSVYTLYDPISQLNTFYPGNGRSLLLTVKANID